MPLLKRLRKSTNSGLSSWIATSVVLAVCASTLVLLGLVERFAHATAARDAAEELNQIAWQLRDQLDRGMSYRYEELNTLVALDDLRKGHDPDKVRTVLERVKNSFPQYAWLGYVDTQGMVEASTGGLLQGKNVSIKDWFQKTMKLGGPYVGDVHNAVLLEKLLPKRDDPWRFVDLTAPVVDEQGRIVHILAAHLSWEWARELQRTLISPAVRTYEAEVFIVNAAGQVLLGPKGTEGKPIELSRVAELAKHPSSDPMQTWKDGVSYATAVQATKGHERYPGLGWIVVVRQAEDVAFSDFARLRIEIILGGLGTCLIALFCAPIVAKRLTRPLEILTQSLDARLHGHAEPIPRLVDGYHEARALSQALADMTEREEQHVHELEQRVQERTAEIHARERDNRRITQHLRTITDNLPALVADVTPDLRYRFANRAYRDWLGVDPDKLVGQTMHQLYGDENMQAWQPFLDAVLKGERVEFERHREVNGETRYDLAIYLPQIDSQGEVAGFHALIFDITARKALEMRLKNEATHDALTGLPNRRNLIDRLPQSIARCDRQKSCLALLFLDLNGFKAVNDTHGHDAGDELLKQAASRMQSVLRKSDTVFRLAGDEFVILLDTLNGGEEHAHMVADKIDQAIKQPFDLNGIEVRISVSTGVSMHWPGDKQDADALIASADAAMYAAKKSRKAVLAPV